MGYIQNFKELLHCYITVLSWSFKYLQAMPDKRNDFQLQLNTRHPFSFDCTCRIYQVKWIPFIANMKFIPIN